MDANRTHHSHSSNRGRDQHDPHDSGRSSTDQAPLHDPGGPETPPARDTQGSTSFVVRVGLEAARSYPARQRASRDTIRNDLWLYGNAYVTTDGERIDPTTLVIYSNPCRTVDLYP
jgi:hypothetical protein